MSEETLNDKIARVEYEVMSGLKDFQRDTVERVDHLFRNNQNRVLVADEVGMGKTMIAKGVIAKFARLRKEEGDDLVKVVYICSNQSIANQNISELDIFNIGHEDVANTRLSMQHLMIQMSEQKGKNNYLQLIPLTPETSFRQTSGCGNVNERYVMYLVLRQMPVFQIIDDSRLENLLMMDAESSWNYWKTRNEDYCNNESYKYKSLVREYENYETRDVSNPYDIFGKLEQNINLLSEIAAYLAKGVTDRSTDKMYVIKLRKLFAAISVDMLNPDLVIMDEFQRFQFLLNNKDDDTRTLVDKFLNVSSDSLSSKVRVLLLSATPYKLYTTLEELGDANDDESYREFFQVMNFLNNDEDKNKHFSVVWNTLSDSLKHIDTLNWEQMLHAKTEAENMMFSEVCRTERISVMDNGDYIDDSSKLKPLSIQAPDVLAHVDASYLLSKTNLPIKFPIDYIKSCPYALSFMQKYETKKRIKDYFKKHKKEIDFAKSKLLWINKDKINVYKDLPPVNARLERLKEETFDKQNLSRLLWLPPTRPYYDLQGVFKGKDNYSKILIFSSWEMVPRMISSLISYEEEKLTISVLAKEVKKSNSNHSLKNTNYFAKRGYPYPRLVPKNKGLLCLLYPSRRLADLYRPLDMYKQGVTSLKSLEKFLWQLTKESASSYIEGHIDENQPVDVRWYYVLPMVMDGLEYVNEWRKGIAESLSECNQSEKESELERLIAETVSLIAEPCWMLGRLPSDLFETIVNMELASPAVCFYRLMAHSTLENLSTSGIAFNLANSFINYLNSRVNTAIIDLAIDKTHDEGSHWKNTLIYCKQGNLQAVLDEYTHLLTKGHGVNSETIFLLKRAFMVTFNLSTANYRVESFKDFKDKILNGYENSNNTLESATSLRTHFAVAFTKSDNKDNEVINRKDAVRIAFNSPFWPFVLASTSIGQEGLDFHLYCRKVMHWNLPGNPIDLEQREGRINRYKCLAIRQNVVQKYGDRALAPNAEDIWDELFKQAEAEKKPGQSDLVPYWCFGENQKIKIERILAHYPLSKDEERYERLIKILSLYRLTMGQPRQEELLSYIFRNFDDTEKLKDLFIDLSPFSKMKC